MAKIVKRNFCILLAALTLPALVVGCGSDDEGVKFDVRANVTLSQNLRDPAKHVVLLNEVCKRRWPIIYKNFTQYSGWQDAAELRRRQIFAKSVRESFLAGLGLHIFDRIYRLGAPEGEAAEIEEVIAALQYGIEQGREMWITEPATLESLFAPYHRLARAYGLDECLIDIDRLRRAQAPSGSGAGSSS